MSLQKTQVLSRLLDDGIVAVLRADSEQEAINIAEACLEGGIGCLEVAYTIPGAHKIIEYLAVKHPEACVGAGTVLDTETARVSMLSGARYIVSPYLHEGMMQMCNRYRVPCLPGAMTIQDIIRALELGADIIKLFPGELYGPTFIKTVKGPIPQAALMPTGGVNLNNVSDWLKAGAVALGVGSSLIGSHKGRAYRAITDRAHQFVHEVNRVRQELSSTGKVGWQLEE